jgi:hypothetical protein
MNKYFVSKFNDTSADTLLAIGFASYLGDIYRNIHGTSEDIFVSDMGSCYAIELPSPLTLEDVGTVDLSGITLVSPLDSSKQPEKLEKKSGTKPKRTGFDYDKAMDDNRIHRERVKQLPGYLQTPDARMKLAPELMEIPEPPTNTYLGHYLAIKMMKIPGPFNELARRWIDLTEQQKQFHLALLLELFSHPDNDVDSAVAPSKALAKEQNIKGDALVSALQIINPTMGKGANRTKARELSIGNQDSFWLLELFKFKGFMEAAAPIVIKESKDRKTYVLQPKKIELDTLQRTMRTFRAALWSSTAIKLDILASLYLAQIFVQQYIVLFERNIALKKWQRQKLISITQGFEVAHYKDLGSAYATMNVSEMHLPVWLGAMESKELVNDAQMLLEEHIHLIQHIHTSKGEEGAEEYELLRFYRDFLSGNDLQPFWKFTTAFSGYLMSARHNNRYMPQITTQGLEKLLMNQQENGIELTDIVSNPGFKSIAYAIRQSTVTAQYRWSQENDRTYEVRYGLGQELMRRVHDRDEFLATLGEFLVKYNAETAREDEKAARAIAKEMKQTPHSLTSNERYKYNLRKMVSPQHLNDIMELMDRSKSSELIGSLLVAYGYARDSLRESRDEHHFD